MSGSTTNTAANGQALVDLDAATTVELSDPIFGGHGTESVSIPVGVLVRDGIGKQPLMTTLNGSTNLSVPVFDPVAGTLSRLPLSALPSSGGSATALPAAAPLLATDASGTAQAVKLGSNLALSGGTLSASGTLTGNASAQTITATAASTPVALADLAARIVYPEDFGAKGDGTTDDAPAFQRAHDALTSSYGSTVSGGIIQCRASRYYWNSALVVTQNITIRGTGATDGPEPLSGTTFVVNNTGFIPLTVINAGVSGRDPRGFRFQGISWEHAQNYPASPFVPVDYPPAMLMANTFGGFLIDDVTFKGATRGILTLGCGHFEIRKVIGQVFRYLVSIDGCYDSPKIDHLRCWTYVSTSNAIEVYCQANTVAIEVARCDGIDLGNVFAFSHLSVARSVMGHQVALVPTAAVASGSTIIPMADTSGLCAGMKVTGTGVPPGASIAAVIDATHFSLSTASVAAIGTVAPLVFGCYGTPQLASVAGTATLTAGSTVIPLSNSSGLWVGQNIVAEFLPLTAVIVSISSSVITVSQPTTIDAGVGSELMFCTGFPSAFVNATAAASASTTLTVSVTGGTVVPNMLLVPQIMGHNVEGFYQARVLTVSGATVTLDTAVTVANGAALIFQMPPAGNTNGGVSQFDAHSLSGDRNRFMTHLDGLSGLGTNFYYAIDNLTSGGQDSSQNTQAGTPLALAYGLVVNCDLAVFFRVKTLTLRQYSTSAVRLGGGSDNHIQIGHATTGGLDIDQSVWGERPLFNIEGSTADYEGYPNTITIEDMTDGAPNGGPLFSVPSGVNAMGFCHRYDQDNAGTTLFGVSSGSYESTFGGAYGVTAGQVIDFVSSVAVGFQKALYVEVTAAQQAQKNSLIARIDYDGTNNIINFVGQGNIPAKVQQEGIPLKQAITSINGDKTANYTAQQSDAGGIISFGSTGTVAMMLTLPPLSMGTEFDVINNGTSPIAWEASNGTAIYLGAPGVVGVAHQFSRFHVVYRSNTTVFIYIDRLPVAKLTLAQLNDGSTWPAAAHDAEQAWCSDARVVGQTAGNGTGSYVQSSGGTWVTTGGNAILN